MKKNALVGLLAGFVTGTAAAVAGAIAVRKVAEEIKDDMGQQIFPSPEGNNLVTLTRGTSETAKGLTLVKVTATSEEKEDECKLTVLAKKGTRFLSGEWLDNDHFQLLVGNGKHKQCCDVSFDEDEIKAQYYFLKVTL